MAVRAEPKEFLAGLPLVLIQTTRVSTFHLLENNAPTTHSAASAVGNR
jgi:hypothetical protein